ncbi:hypothetical protein ACFL27_15235 [candidate division CSSED10-310 bacterium]|uniref:Type II secretion system protein n=1 Tax=candidate division CSSED10-310 bacterium TaxID=2855610 RepID=A0ABV6YZQ5_UNCC1
MSIIHRAIEKKKKLPVTAILIEMFSVIFAVLVTLSVVNKWRERNANQELTRDCT